ncbi:MAG: V-type ATP synthase subunit E [Anaerolineae bacterium]
MTRQDVESLTEDIMSGAERDRQRILKDAEMRAESILAQARREAEAEKASLIEDAETEAARVKQQAQNAAELEVRAIKMEKREDLLNQVFEQASDRMSDPDDIEDYAQILEGLIEDAGQHIRGRSALVILADAKSRGYLDDGVLARLSDVLECDLSLAKDDLAPPAVGVVIESIDGRIRYDNTLQTRLERMRRALRPVVYRILMGDEA